MTGSLAFDGAAGNAFGSLIPNRSYEVCGSAFGGVPIGADRDQINPESRNLHCHMLPSLRLPPASLCCREMRGGPSHKLRQPDRSGAAGTARGKPLGIWWQDEARVGQQGTLTRIWAPRGSRPGVPRDRRYVWAYLFGVVCPACGVGAAVVMPTVNIEAMNLHLAEISIAVAPGADCLPQVDGAGWHRPSPRSRVPDNITLLMLPPYTPELNPTENIWDYLRANPLSNTVWETYKAILDACSDAWNKLTARPNIITSIASRAWATQATLLGRLVSLRIVRPQNERREAFDGKRPV